MKDLYEITGSTGEGVFEVRLNSGHDIFRGHFPGNPVLPGICSLMIVRECASRMAGLPLTYASVGESKFLSAITPDDELSIALKVTGERGGGGEGCVYPLPLSATICSEYTTMLKLKANLIPDER